jgi:hypothetical protein
LTILEQSDPFLKAAILQEKAPKPEDGIAEKLVFLTPHGKPTIRKQIISDAESV